MIKTIFRYLYFRTFEVISKTNKTSPESSSARLLSVVFFVNILTIYSFFYKTFDSTIFYFFCFIGVVILILTTIYFNINRCKSIIMEFKNLEIQSVYKYLAEGYPYVSFFILLISLEVNFTTLIYYLGILILIKLVTHFWNI